MPVRGHWHRVSFNATNESTVNARITQLGPTYGRINGIQRARLIKVGLNVEF